MALHFLAVSAFDDLLTVWRRHDDLRRRRVPVRDLEESRRALDEARGRMRRLRLALHPEPAERDEALVSMLCETLDEVVDLHVAHRDPDRPGVLRCPCGHVVPIPDAAWQRLLRQPD